MLCFSTSAAHVWHAPCSALVTATALAVKLAPLLPQATTIACARHAAMQSSGDRSGAGDGTACSAATQMWCQEAAAPASDAASVTKPHSSELLTSSNQSSSLPACSFVLAACVSTITSLVAGAAAHAVDSRATIRSNAQHARLMCRVLVSRAAAGAGAPRAGPRLQRRRQRHGGGGGRPAAGRRLLAVRQHLRQVRWSIDGDQLVHNGCQCPSRNAAAMQMQ